MKNSHAMCRALGSFVLLFVLTTAAQALSSRTWVAGDGNDANPCTLALPCLSFAVALTQTVAGGEINVKNSGAFGVVTINKSITIDGGGTFSSILAGSGLTGVLIDDSTSATPNTAVVTLRNLSINGAGPTLGLNGVRFTFGKTLNIENCRIFNFLNTGVNVGLQASGDVSIKNSSIFSAGGTAVGGGTTVGFVNFSLNGCSIEESGTGVLVNSHAFVSIRDSVIQFNQIGIWVLGSGDAISFVTSHINNNWTGLYVSAATTATLASSTFMDNTTNFTNLGTIQTFGNNETADPIPGVVTNLTLQ